MLWHCALVCSSAQDATLFNQVIASTGKSALQQGLIFTYTVGEAVVPTFTIGDFTLTQGFHQPEQTRIVSVEAPDFVDWQVEAFPNPVADFLTIRYAAQADKTLRVTVTDLLGRIIISDFPLTQPDGTQLDCRSWQPGVYVLLLQEPSTHSSATARIVRL